MFDFTTHSAETAQMSANALSVLKNAVQSDIDSERMYGGAMIVARHGKIVLRETFGTTDGKRATMFDDVYLMMSVSKSFTALLTLQAVERGLFGLDTRIAERLPEFAAHGKESITVFHLLTHQAGMFGMLIMPDLSPSDRGNIDAVFAKACQMPADFAAGTKVSYSSIVGYGVLGKLLEHTDPKGRPFAQIAQEELFAPLQMNSRFGDMQDSPHRVAVSHTPKMRTLGDTGMGNLDMIEQFLNGMAGADSILPAGNAFGNIDDLYRFAENLRLNRMGQGVRLISPAMANYATQNHCGEMNNAIFEAECEKLHLAPLKAHFSLHGGYVRGHGHLLNAAGFTASPTAFSGMGGGSTFYMVDPERELTVAFLSAGFIDGLPHLIRTAKLNDLAIAACL